MGLLSRDFIKPILPAVILSVPITCWLIRKLYLQNFAYQAPVSIRAFIIAGLAALVIAMITDNIQTIRTATSNTVDTLRYE
jgi:putative ABC transport system permease protein